MRLTRGQRDTLLHVAFNATIEHRIARRCRGARQRGGATPRSPAKSENAWPGSAHPDGDRVDTPGDNLEGLNDVRSVAMMRTPDGRRRIELAEFHTPPAVRTEPESALGIRRIMFAVDDVDDVVARLRRTVANSSARSRSTRTSTGSASCVALRTSSSDWPSSSAEPSKGAAAGGPGARRRRLRARHRWELQTPSRSQRGGSDIAPNAPPATATRALR
jgi:hypothetical protein